MIDWLTPLSELLERGQHCAVVTVADARGSVPREVGSKMLITGASSIGSIGGGHLEFKATEIARKMLDDGEDAHSSLRSFALGPELGQCCGGRVVLLFESVTVARAEWVKTMVALRDRGEPMVLVRRTDATGGDDRLVVTAEDCHGCLGDVEFEGRAVSTARSLMAAGPQLRSIDERGEGGSALLFEPLRASDFHIELFGAGHVGRAMVRVLAGLPCTVRWIDSREAQFPHVLPSNVAAHRADGPEYEVDEAPPGSYFLVMTHRHSLDQAICERILRRGDFRYCGLIGSLSKRRRFEKRLLARGVGGEVLARLTCPIGVSGISGKRPGEIAVAAAAELLQVRGSVALSRDDVTDQPSQATRRQA